MHSLKQIGQELGSIDNVVNISTSLGIDRFENMICFVLNIGYQVNVLYD